VSYRRRITPRIRGAALLLRWDAQTAEIAYTSGAGTAPEPLMSTSPAPITLNDVARLIGQPPAVLAAGLEPADGLRVWGHSGIATVHAGGKIRLVVRDRRVHTVVCTHDSDKKHL
jgi:hypothetical protein